MAKYDAEKLLFRRQFILGPAFVEAFPAWKKGKLQSGLCLTVHPDLAMHQVTSGSKTATLLGYILDPSRPEAGDIDILNRLVNEPGAGQDSSRFLKNTENLGGRWILIVEEGPEARLFHDPIGYRQVYYGGTLASEMWCASQPGHIAKALDLEADEKAQAFLEMYQSHEKEYWWPGDSSLYREIKHLLPNHYLDLKTGEARRYWPDRELLPMSLEQAVEANSALLKGMVKAAHNRFPLAITQTSGRDTRLLLAASRDMRADLFYFTMIYWSLNEDSPDVQIPARLLAQLGLKHHLMECPEQMDLEFEKIYAQNVTTARPIYGPLAQTLYQHYPANRVCLKGNGVPVVKSSYLYKFQQLPKGERGEITGAALARLTGMRDHAFAIDAFEKWLASARNPYNVHVLDLLWWENREGNWQAMSQLEWDIAQEVLIPFNCRAFLTNALGVDKKERQRPGYRFHQELTRSLWPEILSEPINPGKKKAPIRKQIRQGIRKHAPLGLRRWFVELKKRLR